MKLKFQTNFGYRFELDVSRDDSLQEIKLKIYTIYGVPISSQTLSINGIIIANDNHLITARLTDGSEIRLDVADEAPTQLASPGISDHASTSAQTRHRENRGSAGASNYAAAESDEPKMLSLTLKLPEPLAAVNRVTTDDETILQLKQWIRRSQGIPIDILIKDPSGIELLDDAMTLRESQIPDKSELAVEFLLASVSSVLSIRVILKYEGERQPVEVDATDKVSQLRTMLEENQVAINADLPNPYFFAHKQDPIDENFSFVTLNIVDGDIIEILPGRLAVNMNLKLETNIPHRKPFIYVGTYSDDTILQLKEKIGRNEGIPVRRIMIRKNGIVQPDHSPLHACSITSDEGVMVEILE